MILPPDATRNEVKLRTYHVVGDCSLVQWGKTCYPTIANRWDLYKHPSIRGLPARLRRMLLHDASQRTPLERGTHTDMLGISRRDASNDRNCAEAVMLRNDDDQMSEMESSKQKDLFLR